IVNGRKQRFGLALRERTSCDRDEGSATLVGGRAHVDDRRGSRCGLRVGRVRGLDSPQMFRRDLRRGIRNLYQRYLAARTLIRALNYFCTRTEIHQLRRNRRSDLIEGQWAENVLGSVLHIGLFRKVSGE